MEHTKTIYKSIHHKIKNSQNIALFGHVHIDGDALGSMLWLWRILEKIWKNVSYFTPEKPAKSFDFIAEINKIKYDFDYQNYDCLIFLDFSGYDRIAKFTKEKEEYFNNHFLIIIDHHLSDTPKETNIQLKDVSAPSACDIVFEFIESQRHKYIDAQTAQYLYLWITTDTGNFIFGNNKSSIRNFENAKKLLEYGADKLYIIKNIFYQQSLPAIKFMEKLLHRTKLNWKILYTYYSDKDLHKYHLDAEQAKIQFNAIITKTFWPELIILFKKRKTEIGGSIRQGNNAKQLKHNCGDIARNLFQWWWHQGASWFSVPSSWLFSKQIKKICKTINEYLDKK